MRLFSLIFWVRYYVILFVMSDFVQFSFFVVCRDLKGGICIFHCILILEFSDEQPFLSPGKLLYVFFKVLRIFFKDLFIHFSC